ncbi:hypothetical protein [Nocardia paucivorans]|uniref:hypothetical protein n=1 Tax=Nocardia paucivorans TaxID=114259 RepID=UPI0002E0B325|nr:hypothetical protein [Nocardia paucivorans]
MKRVTLALVTAGMILGGAGVVEILDTDITSSAPVFSPDDPKEVTIPRPVDDRTVELVDLVYRDATWLGLSGAIP